MILTARVYEPPSPEDGYRLLVMRFWPRGVRKEAVDGWERELAPSAELLRSYRAGRIAWQEFARRYRAQVSKRRYLVDELAGRAERDTVTLLCGCRDESRCHRTLLKEMVEDLLVNGHLVGSGMINGRCIRTMIDVDRQGVFDRSKEIWQLLTLELWFSKHVA